MKDFCQLEKSKFCPKLPKELNEMARFNLQQRITDQRLDRYTDDIIWNIWGEEYAEVKRSFGIKRWSPYEVLNWLLSLKVSFSCKTEILTKIQEHCIDGVVLSDLSAKDWVDTLKLPYTMFCVVRAIIDGWCSGCNEFIISKKQGTLDIRLNISPTLTEIHSR